MTPRLSKFVLTVHITTSVGWLGAVAGFLVLSIASLTSRDAELVRGAYLSMNLIGLYVLVPLSFAALLTGLIQSLGTHWGLFRHYWVLTKLVLTIGAAALLLMHQFSIMAELAGRASHAPAGALPQVGSLGNNIAGKAGLGFEPCVTTSGRPEQPVCASLRIGTATKTGTSAPGVCAYLVNSRLMRSPHGRSRSSRANSRTGLETRNARNFQAACSPCGKPCEGKRISHPNT